MGINDGYGFGESDSGSTSDGHEGPDHFWYDRKKSGDDRGGTEIDSNSASYKPRFSRWKVVAGLAALAAGAFLVIRSYNNHVADKQELECQRAIHESYQR